MPWLLAANLIFVALLPFTPARRGFIRNVLLADFAVLVLTAPLYVLLLHFEGQTVIYSLSWIPPLNAARIWYNFGSVYFMHVADWVSYRLLNHYAVPGLVWVIDMLLLLALAAGGWGLRRRPQVLVVLGIAFLFLPCLFLLISLRYPILLPRYLLWSAAPFAILVGIGAAAMLESWSVGAVRLVVVGAAAVLLVNLVPYYHVETKPRWDLAARMLAGEVNPGDVVYFSDASAPKILRLYMPATAQAVVLGDSSRNLAHAEKAISEGKRVWVVYGHAGQNTSTPASFFGPVHALGIPSLVQEAGSRIIITLYDPAVTLNSCTPLGLKDGICG